MKIRRLPHDLVVGFVCRKLLVALSALLATAALGRAELVRLEEAVKRPAAEVAAELNGGKAVVCVRSVGRASLPWAVHEGLATELSAALRRAGIEAIPAAADVRVAALSNARIPFSAADARRASLAEADYLVAGSLEIGAAPSLKLAIWQLDPPSLLWSKGYPLPRDVLDLHGNIPELNRKVVEYCQANFDRKVGSGVCAQLATVSLEAAGARRQGVYTWGRELAPQEPIMPGDILQLEVAELRAPGFNKNFPHHTAVVEQVRPDALVVLHQNVPPKGQIVQRETWPRNGLKSGYIIAYRPTVGDSPLPRLSPKRRTAPNVVKRGQVIDLLRTIDPRLDAVRGIWFIEDNTLRMNRDDYARLQVPVAPPERYTLRLRVKRLEGNDQFAVGLVVGGHQTMYSFDAYGGSVSGLHLVDGRKVRDNPLAYRGETLAREAATEIVLRVTADSVQAEVNGTTVADWKGDPARLSVDPNYAVPNTEWLFLAAWNSHFAISEFTLEEDTSGSR